MGSKRAQKAKKRAQRQAKREVRRARSAAQAGKSEAEPATANAPEPAEVLPSPTPEPSSVKGHSPPAQVAEKQAPRDPHIGYVAFSGFNMACDGDGCIVAGSREKMQEIAKHFGEHFARHCTIQATGFQRIFQAMQLGGAYCLDEEAYGRFLEPARRRGMALSEQDFSEPGPYGLHFVRVQWFG